MSTTDKIKALLYGSALAILLSACSGTTTNKPDIVAQSTYVDSTVYFAEETASLSMRARFKLDQSSTMEEGYKFQFRTLSEQPVFLNSISIISGGKRLFLEEGQIVLPKGKGVTLQLSLEESLFVAQYPSALIQFRHNNESFIFAIELHQLSEFKP